MMDINYRDAKIDFFVSRTSGKKVLDLGVVQHGIEKEKSPNWLHRAIVANSRACVGLDIDKDGVDYLNGKGFSIVYADAQDFDLEEKFEVVAAGDIIEHLSNVGEFLDSVARHLEENGKFLISTPNPFWWKTTMFIIFRKKRYVHEQHTCWFCVQTLRQVLARHGFEVVEVEYRSVYDIHSVFHKITRIINNFFPFPGGIRHNTIFLATRKAS